MKPEENLEEVLRDALPSASKVEAESAGGRVLERLQLDPHAMPSSIIRDFDPSRRSNWRGVSLMAAAAAIVLAVLVPMAMFRNAPATLEVAARKVYFGEPVRSELFGEVVVLADGSRVEMRAQSELVLERADDGVRIRLGKGGIIVKAAKQRIGHLYVQTKDVTVSVVGTLFLVNAEEEGSRVAVIEGEVRVKQGTHETKLGPGEQVTSNPKMESHPVKEELAWSREAVAHVALLETTAPQRGAQPRKEERPAFDVASIRPTASVPPGNSTARGANGGGDGSANRRAGPNGCTPDSANLQKFDPQRVYIPMATLAQLIAHSYPIQNYPGWARPSMGAQLDGNFITPSAEKCGMLGNMGILTGGPDWVRTEQWDLEAAIPEGLFTNRPNPLTDPKIQQMIHDLLVERFKLVIHRETKEIPVYLLKVGKDGPRLLKENSGKDSNVVLNARGQVQLIRNPNGSVSFKPGLGLRGMSGWNASMEVLAQFLANGPGSLKRLVLDRTGLAGRYDFEFDDDVPIDWKGPLDAVNQSHVTAKRNLIKALGLELEEAKGTFEVWVIDHAEKPSEN